MRKIFPLAVFALLFVASAGAAEACECGQYASVCGAYQAADAVFVGSVQKVKQVLSEKVEGGEGYTADQLIHIRVERVFKGMKRQAQVIFRTPVSSCTPTYKQGQRWLFYAYYDQKSKRWGTQFCDRNSLVEHAADDLLYLQGLPASAQKTRIAGELVRYEDDPVEGPRRFKNITGAKIKITGEGRTYEVYTNENGVYEIYGLPPGKYVVEPERLAGLKVGDPLNYGEQDDSGSGPPKLVLTEKGCAGADFVYSKAKPD